MPRLLQLLAIAVTSVMCLGLAGAATAAHAQSPTSTSSVSDNEAFDSEENAVFESTATVGFSDDGPGPTGLVTFNVYKTDDALCNQGTFVEDFGEFLQDMGNLESREAFLSTNRFETPGTYEVVASYPGDENYGPSTGVCGDDTFVVEPPQPFLDLQVRGCDPDFCEPEVQQGQSLVLEGELGNTVDPTGTVTFNLYAPDEEGDRCAGTPEDSDIADVEAEEASSRELFPDVTGTYTAQAVYSGDTNDGPLTSACISITVTAPPEGTLTPTSLTFAAQPVGTIGRAQTVTLTNTGSVPLSVSGVSLTDEDEFLISSDTCSARGTPASAERRTASRAAGNDEVGLEPNETCTISVRFTPQGTGERTATLNVATDDPDSPATASLAGTGAPSGAAGGDGADGADGVDGADGTNGVPGSNGATGPAGPEGARGLTGETGSTGAAALRGPRRSLSLLCSTATRTCRVALALSPRARLIRATLKKVRGKTRTSRSITAGGVLRDSRGRPMRLTPGVYKITVRIARGKTRTITRFYTVDVLA